jgi:membrane-associated protein
VLLFLLGGWWFGGREIVQKNFKLVILAIIVISVLPAVVEYLRARIKSKAPALGTAPAPLGEETAA